MSEKRPHIALRILKVFGWTIFGLAVLVLAIRLSLKTSPVHKFAKNKAISIASKNLNGTLDIAHIEGDLWNDFSLSKIILTDPDTVLTIDSLHVSYDIWSLLKGTFSASAFGVYGMNASIIESPDSTFNIQHFIKSPEAGATAEKASTSSFGFNLQNITLRNSNIYVRSESYLPDSTLRIRSLNAAGSISLFDEISGALSSLSFKVKEGRLPSAISIETAGSYADQEITLDQLVIETGRSLFKAGGVANLRDSTFQAKAETIPFSLQDLQPYLDRDIPTQQLQLTLKAAGNMDSLHIELTAEGEGFDDFLAISDFSFTGTPTLTKLGISAQNLDIGYFTNDSLKATVAGFQATVEGQITQDYPAMNATWGFTFSDIHYQHFVFETFFGSGSIIDNELLANFQVSDGEDKIVVNPQVEQLFDEYPAWQVPIFVSNLNLSWWLQNPELKGELSFRGQVEGKGFQLSEKPWMFSFRPSMSIKRRPTIVKKSGKPDRIISHIGKDTLTINDQVISDFNVEGSVTQDSLTTNGFVQLIDSKATFSATIADFLEEQPSYTYQFNTSDFNVAEIANLEDFPTNINLEAKGSGKFFDPEKLELQSKLLIDSSYVNGANFDLLDIDAQLRRSILTISSGQLVSEILEGTFSGRKNLRDPTDPQNDFALNMQINNLQPFASLVGAEVLKANGNVNGHVIQTDSNNLQFDGNVELYDLQYDTLYYAENINGKTKISIGKTYGYDLSLHISEPAYTKYNLQDIQFTAKGIAVPDDSLAGNFSLEIDSKDAGTISQSGNFFLNPNSLQTKLTWYTFEFRTPARVLTLQSPFSLTYQDYTIRTDTLRLRSDGGTYLDLCIPYADSLNQEIWAKGRDFDFGVMQEIVFDERFVDGILSGDLKFKKTPQAFSGNGAFSISNLAYKGSEADILSLDFDLADQRLKADLAVIMQGEEKVSGNLNIPFVGTDPNDLTEAFFNEPVNGRFVINPIYLHDLQNLLTAFDITETDGVLSFNGELSGTVGTPNFEGIFHLGNPKLSGIKVDTAYARFQYHHLDQQIVANAGIDAKGQNAASILATLPLSIDFRTQKINMPEPTDSLSIRLLTDNFNISVFNDFLNRQYMNKLKGFVNADINIAGTTEKLTPKGSLRLDNAQVEVPIAGIKLSKISSNISLTESGLKLNSFKATSGSGTFNADGSIDLEGITPKNLNISAKARRFRLANTSDYNLTIDLNSTLTGNPSRPKASGSLTIKNGFIFLQDFGEKSVEDVTLESEEASSFSPYDSLAMDMRFLIERNFKVRNRRYLDLDISLIGELDAQKQTGGDLQLFGTLNGEKGYVRPLGKQFTLEDGRFTFSGPIDNPELYIKTSYIPQSSQKEGTPIILYYIIEGNASDPNFHFESDPQMEQQDIICYTLFNKPCYALSSWQQVVSGGSGSSPSDLLVGVLLDEFESLATQELGIDVVEIDNTRTGSNSGTSIKTGWYLNRKTFFAIVNEISGSTPKTLFILEYMLNKNLDLIITQGDDNRQGVDIRWQYDY